MSASERLFSDRSSSASEEVLTTRCWGVVTVVDDRDDDFEDDDCDDIAGGEGAAAAPGTGWSGDPCEAAMASGAVLGGKGGEMADGVEKCIWRGDHDNPRQNPQGSKTAGELSWVVVAAPKFHLMLLFRPPRPRPSACALTRPTPINATVPGHSQASPSPVPSPLC